METGVNTNWLPHFEVFPLTCSMWNPLLSWYSAPRTGGVVFYNITKVEHRVADITP